MEYIITFKNTNFAIKAEKLLLDRKIPVSVMPLPSQIRAGCGICLRVKPEAFRPTREALLDEGIVEIEIYSRVTENNKFLYNEVEDGDIWRI